MVDFKVSPAEQLLISKTVYVALVEGGGEILTQKLDFVAAAEIAHGARLQGKLAVIGVWTRQTTELWYRRIGDGSSLVAQVSLFAGSFRHVVNALIPYGLPVPLACGVVNSFEPAVVPPGSIDEDPYFTPPDPMGFAKEPNDG